jgi:hypothetical protein
MRAFGAFTFAIIMSAGSVAPTQVVTGHDLFHVVFAALLGYLGGGLLSDTLKDRKAKTV